MLHIAGLLERPDEGDIIVDGKSAGAANDRERTALRRRFLGFVYQYHHLLPEFSAIENVMLPQMLNGRSRARRAPMPPSFWRWCSSRTAPTTGRGACRAASSSAWRSRGPSPTRRACCWPTSRPATSMSSTADAVFRQLLSLVRDTGMAALVATHNPDLAARMDRTVTLKDGVLTG